jgi:hypothetical protein
MPEARSDKPISPNRHNGSIGISLLSMLPFAQFASPLDLMIAMDRPR